MNEPADSDREELLLRLLGAADDPRAAFEASELVEDPELVERFEELMDAKDLLETAGRDAFEEIEEAGGLRGAPGQQRVGDVLQGLADEAAPSGATPARPQTRSVAASWRWFVAAAAAGLLAFVWLRGLEDPGPQRPYLLNGSDAELVRPIGEVADFDIFQWKAVRPPGGWYVLRIRSADGAILVATEELTETLWRPADHDPLPDDVRHISWEVEVHDGASPRPVRVFHAEAFLD